MSCRVCNADKYVSAAAQGRMRRTVRTDDAAEWSEPLRNDRRDAVVVCGTATTTTTTTTTSSGDGKTKMVIWLNKELILFQE